ncbi:ABC transporter ATP-binding protein [Pseudooceanicola sp. CBS1P-1]|uniref:ATP-binding cassette domain-containing protein n=1 Tax=Pseudooceanicola albus TaxID=2692189 RepID=A0A6L7G098_9RHOB|nr:MULTISPECIES: ABC transporter ATP-binding protein [Pseudooceanicola]MBT9383503.1 ABC transporter ATP-binding protein [Pseudooceanicola endophyticus]MXN17359.1 ATP-binding cassette domain-containing protein [Pseudooceanicola albus]
MAELSLNRLGKTYPGSARAALADVTATIADGEFIALLGPSGCGKTTLLRLLAGFEGPTEGEIHVGGTLIASRRNLVPPEERNMGIVFQSYALWPHMSVARNIAYPLEVRGIAKPERSTRVAAALEMTGLSDFADRAPAALSGGQRQRVALARALVADPSAVLLDEPLANLDLALRGTMQEVFTGFHARTGATMVYVTHDQTEAMAMADRVAVMSEGRIRQFAAPEVLYNEPADDFVAGFVGDGAVLPALAEGPRGPGRAQVRVLGHSLEARARCAAPDRICARPEDITLSDTGPIRAEVRACTYQGGRFRLTLAAQGGARLIAFSRARARLGETLGLSLGRPWAYAGGAAHG